MLIISLAVKTIQLEDKILHYSKLYWIPVFIAGGKSFRSLYTEFLVNLLVLIGHRPREIFIYCQRQCNLWSCTVGFRLLVIIHVSPSCEITNHNIKHFTKSQFSWIKNKYTNVNHDKGKSNPQNFLCLIVAYWYLMIYIHISAVYLVILWLSQLVSWYKLELVGKPSSK